MGMDTWRSGPQPGTDEWRQYMSDLTADSLRDRIRELRSNQYLVETNAGTYGGEEAVRKVGTSDPAFADSKLYVTLGGRKHRVGCPRAKAPGYWRFPGRAEMERDRAELRRLENQLAQYRA